MSVKTLIKKGVFLAQKECNMKNFLKVSGAMPRIAAMRSIAIIALLAVIGFSMMTCKEESGDDDPLSKTVKWTASSTSYELVLTDLADANKSVSRTVVPGGRTYVYILSIGTQGYNTGTATISGDEITFTSGNAHSSHTSFKITITEKTAGAVTVTTASSQSSIPLRKADGTTGTSVSIPKLDVSGTVAATSADSNPFVGSWTGGGVSVTARSNLTWSASAQGYNESGSYSPVKNGSDNVAIVYDSKKNLFGYAWMNGSQMRTITNDGGNITFTKK